VHFVANLEILLHYVLNCQNYAAFVMAT